ncbi:MAG: hypothetical protein SGI77_24980 [Pirellulaceae bacterium]|nr:hypothetical protein [Pirellulaceae bacterium]
MSVDRLSQRLKLVINAVKASDAFSKLKQLAVQDGPESRIYLVGGGMVLTVYDCLTALGEAWQAVSNELESEADELRILLAIADLIVKHRGILSVTVYQSDVRSHAEVDRNIRERDERLKTFLRRSQDNCEAARRAYECARGKSAACGGSEAEVGTESTTAANTATPIPEGKPAQALRCFRVCFPTIVSYQQAVNGQAAIAAAILNAKLDRRSLATVFEISQDAFDEVGVRIEADSA